MRSKTVMSWARQGGLGLPHKGRWACSSGVMEARTKRPRIMRPPFVSNIREGWVSFGDLYYNRINETPFLPARGIPVPLGGSVRRSHRDLCLPLAIPTFA